MTKYDKEMEQADLSDGKTKTKNPIIAGLNSGLTKAMLLKEAVASCALDDCTQCETIEPKQFCLSDKEWCLGCLACASYGTKIYYPEDVKEFLKEIMGLLEKHPSQIRTEAVISLIKRKAGAKLTE